MNWTGWLGLYVPFLSNRASSDTAAVQQDGSIVLITGPMFSGKSDQLVLLTNRYVRCRQRVVVIAPRMSVRTDHADQTDAPVDDDDGGVVSRDGLRPTCRTLLLDTDELETTLARIVDEYDVFALDEAQFFDNLIVCARRLRASGKNVLVAGLTLNWQRRSFNEMFDLQRYADRTIQLMSVCNGCARPNATLSYNSAFETRTKSQGDVFVGDTEDGYLALCQCCYDRRRNNDLPRPFSCFNS